MTDRQCKRCGEVKPAEIYTCTPKEQEQDGECQHCDGSGCSACHSAYLVDINPQREWIGLTEDELASIYAEYKSPRNIYLAIESALREKNT